MVKTKKKYKPLPGAVGCLMPCWREYKLVKLLWKTIWYIPGKLKKCVSIIQQIPFLGIWRTEIDKVLPRRTIHKSLILEIIHLSLSIEIDR